MTSLYCIFLRYDNVDCGTISLLFSSARQSFVMKLEVSGCDVRILEMRRANLSRGMTFVPGACEELIRLRGVIGLLEKR